MSMIVSPALYQREGGPVMDCLPANRFFVNFASVCERAAVSLRVCVFHYKPPDGI